MENSILQGRCFACSSYSVTGARKPYAMEFARFLIYLK